MTDLRKAAEMALEALEELRFANAPFLDEAMEALRTALAQQDKECIYPACETGIGCDGPCGSAVKQEPVAWRWKERINDEFDSDWILTTYNPPQYAIQQEPLYAPPKREWVGLTDEEVIECFDSVALGQVDGKYVIDKRVNIFNAIRAIEAKLKEKNS